MAQANPPQQQNAAQPPQVHPQILNVNVSRQLNNLCLELKLAQVAPHIRHFNGEGHHKFLDWCKDMDKCKVQCGGDDDRMRSLALATLTGPAADFLLRVIESNPQVTWNDIKTVLKQRYSDLADVQYARQSLRTLKQSQNESVQNFGERIMAFAREAYPTQNLNDPTIQGQLVEVFADGVKDSSIVRRLIRKKPVDLDGAIMVAAEEQQALKSFELSRSAHREEPMEVDALHEKTGVLEKQLKTLSRQMLTLTECVQGMSISGGGRGGRRGSVGPSRPSGRNQYTSDGRPICHRCGRPGHIARECRQSRPTQYESRNQHLN